MRLRWAILVLIFPLAAGAPSALAQEVADCLACHEDPALTAERDGKQVSRFIDPRVFTGSVHSTLECVACHIDLAGVEFPHSAPLAKVDCGSCHENIAEIYKNSLHGKLAAAGARLAARTAMARTTFCLPIPPRRG